MTPDKEPRAEVSEVNKEELVNAAEDKIDLELVEANRRDWKCSWSQNGGCNDL